MVDVSNREAAVDIYLRTRSGRSLRAALRKGHRFSAGDVGDYAPADRSPTLARVRDLQREGCLSLVEADGFVIRVRAPIAQLEAAFSCRISAVGREPEPRPDCREASPSEFAAALNRALSEHAAGELIGASKADAPFEGRWQPDPAVHLEARFDTEPRLSGCGRWIEGIEPAGRWPIRAERAEIACRMLGHSWDIVLFVSPYGIVECTRCGARDS